jgi:hypothetical protein
MGLSHKQAQKSVIQEILFLLCATVLKGEHISGCANGMKLDERNCRLPEHVAGYYAKMGSGTGLGVYRGSSHQGPNAATSGSATPADCIKYAKNKGFEVWGHRTNQNPKTQHKNSCFYFSYDGSNKVTAADRSSNDPYHLSGCTNGAKIEEGCIEMTYVEGYYQLQHIAGAAFGGGPSGVHNFGVGTQKRYTWMECRNIAISEGVQLWGWRTNGHSNPANRNSCFIGTYDGATDLSTQHRHAPSSHYMGCANGKDILNRCA